MAGHRNDLNERSFADRYGPYALVMGASQGLGLAIAGEIARRGLNLVITARGAGALEQAAAQLRGETGVTVETMAIDAADTDAAAKVCQSLGDREVGLVVYNCAAEPGGLFLASCREDQLQNIAVNCITPTLLIHELARDMVARKRGGIIVCSSLAGVQGVYNRVIYGAAKAYEMILGEGLWAELAQDGVDACTFMIGSTYTPNFIRDQKSRGTMFAETRVPKDAPPGTPLPILPEDAARNLFAQISKAWLPMIFANPEDKTHYEESTCRDRRAAIERMRDMFLTGYRSLKSGTGAT